MNMHYNTSHESAGGSLLAFFAGIATTVAVGGYFLFGPKGRENRRGIDRWVKRMTVEVLDKMEDIEDITEEKYHAIVDEVTARQGQLRGLRQSFIERVREDMKSRWEEMKAAARKARAEALAEMEKEELERRLRGGAARESSLDASFD
jgi:hypothetical protein